MFRFWKSEESPAPDLAERLDLEDLLATHPLLKQDGDWQAIQGLRSGSVQANGLEFHFKEMGDGPIAMCLHGYPDSPWTFRHLMPELALAGYRAVAPYIRGFAPTQVPTNGDYSTQVRINDVIALHEALGGDGNAVLIAHDWGAIASYGALTAQPQRWRRAVLGNIPHMHVLGSKAMQYAQLKRSFYFWFFQMQVAERIVSADDLAFLEAQWRDWSPNYDPAPEMAHAKACLRHLDNLRAALGYYRAYFQPDEFGGRQWASELASLIGHPVPQPTLYLHGEQDGCIAMSLESLNQMKSYLGPGSQVEMLPNAGHFFWVECPQLANQKVIDFLAL